MAAYPVALKDNDPFMVGGWRVEPALDRLSKQGERALLEPKAMAVLVCLATHANEVVSGDTLIAEIWNGRPMGDNPVYKCVAQLRKAFGDDPRNPLYIETVPKKGYRLVAPVTPLEVSSPANGLHKVLSMLLPAGTGRLSSSVVIAAVALTATVVVSALFVTVGEPDPKPGLRHSLAILPFSTDEGVIADFVMTGNGVAEEIANQLARTKSLRVIAHDSVAHLNGNDHDIDTIAELLRVDHVMLGTLDLTDDRVSIRGRLFDAQGREVWGDSFSGREEEIFALIGDIAIDVADSLEVRLDPDWDSTCGGTGNLRACQRYKMAQEHMRNRGENFGESAIQLLEEAIAIDPGFATAHAYMAYAYIVGAHVPWDEALGQAETAVERAFELNSALPEAHRVQGLLRMMDRRCPPPDCRNLHGLERAERSLRRALSLRPGYPDTHNILGIALWNQGKLDEAYSQLNTALMYDPLNPVIISNIAVHKALRGDYTGAVEYLREFVDSNPGAPGYMNRVLADIECDYGNFDTCLSFLHSFMSERSGFSLEAPLREAYMNLGLFDRVDGMLLAHKDQYYLSPWFAWAYGNLLIAQARTEELEEYTRALAEHAGAEYGSPEEWPAWPLRTLGRNLFVLGDYGRAAFYLTQYHGPEGALVDHQILPIELDSLHVLAYSLMKTGEVDRGETIVERSLALLEARKAQGYDGYPGRTYAEARAYALQGKRALAVATLRQAVTQGWRHYWSLIPDDPRWNPVRGDSDFDSILARVREDIDDMTARAATELAHMEQFADR